MSYLRKVAALLIVVPYNAVICCLVAQALWSPFTYLRRTVPW